MSKQIETKKILVNNGQELIAEAKKWKASGGEWRLQEKYWQCPTGTERSKDKENLNWGIIISNSEQTVDICSAAINISSYSANDEIETRDQLHQLFSEAKFAPLNFQRQESNTSKLVKEENGEYHLYRYLVAENFRHLKLIIRDYFCENEAKIYQSSNRNFSDWAKIIDGKDGNIYLYVGEKNSNDGREIKIGIKKSDFEKGKSSNFSANELLETSWKLLIMNANQPLTPDEKKTYYYEGTEEHWQAIQKFWKNACRFTLESLRNRLIEKLDYLTGEPNEKEIRDTNEKITKINQRLCYMKENHSNWYNNYDKFCCPKCERRMCCEKEGHICGKESQGWIHSFGENDSQLPILPKPNQKNNPISDKEESQLRRYFLEHAIQRITLNNGKLEIEYNDKSKKTLELKDDQQLQKYQGFIQNQPNHSLSLEQLLKIDTSSSNQSPNDNLAIGLTVGGVILVGIIIFSTLIIRKRNKKFSKN